MANLSYVSRTTADITVQLDGAQYDFNQIDCVSACTLHGGVANENFTGRKAITSLAKDYPSRFFFPDVRVGKLLSIVI